MLKDVNYGMTAKMAWDIAYDYWMKDIEFAANKRYDMVKFSVYQTKHYDFEQETVDRMTNIQSVMIDMCINLDDETRFNTIQAIRERFDDNLDFYEEAMSFLETTGWVKAAINHNDITIITDVIREITWLFDGSLRYLNDLVNFNHALCLAIAMGKGAPDGVVEALREDWEVPEYYLR